MADKRISQLIERVDIANNDVLPIVASGATTTNKVTISTIQDWMQSNLDVGVTSVGLTMPSAFQVSGSPITTSGNINVTATGTASQYIRGDGTLADFPEAGGGGASVSYYLNGSVSQGTIGGVAYREMNKVPVLGAGTDININADGYIASFITDAGDPSLLEIPAGNWNFETYLSASSGGGSPTFYIELYKVNSGGTATLIASNSATPESISLGTNINPYFSALAVPTTTLALTDRLALRYYVTPAGRTITLHTENSHLCQIITTFTTGLTALNGLTAQVQNFATGTSGTDFNISSTGSIHTFNLPDASASNRGAVTTGSQVFGGVKTFANGVSLSAVGGSNQVTRIVNIGTLHEGTASVNQIGFNSGNNIYFGKGLNNGGVISWNNAAVRYYTLPDADGTIALTSQIPANIVTGTGAQGRVAYWDSTGVIKSDSLFQWNDFSKRLGIGRTPTVSLDVQGSQNISGTITAESTGGSGLRIYAGSGTNQWDMYLNSTNLRFSDNTGTGSVVFDRPLNGTSASFSGTVTTPFIGVTGSTGQIGNINSTNANGGYITWQTSGTTIADLGSAQQIFGAGGSDTFGINARGARSLMLGTNDTTRLTISSTGAATFSSSVTASSVIAASATFSNFGSATSAVVGFGDANTGFFRPAANSLSITTNGVQRQIINLDGAMGFNYPILGSRSFVFRTISGRPLTLETIAPTGIHSLYLRPNDSGRHLISSNYLSGGVYLPLALSGRENDADFVLSTSGNVGIGTASPAVKFEVAGSGSLGYFRNPSSTPATTFLTVLNANNTSNGLVMAHISDGTGYFGTQNNADLRFCTNDTERMRITSGGDLLVGATSNSATSDDGSKFVSNGRLFQVSAYSDNTQESLSMYSTTASAYRFYVGWGGTIFATNTTISGISDARLKENVRDLDAGLDKIMALKPRVFDWKEGKGKDIKNDRGFIAQEFEEVFPDLIDEYKQEVEEGEEPYKSVRADLIPVLVKAIQELKTEIDSLKNQMQ